MTDILYANAYILAYSAKNMLNKDRMRAMLGASTPSAVAMMLCDLGYGVTSGTDDEIIDTEREKTYKTFMELCTDPALSAVITLKHNFITTPLDKNLDYHTAEKNLFTQITEQIPKIKSKNIQNYFQFELSPDKHAKSSDEHLYKLACIEKNDLDTMGPLFHWYILKQSEFRAVKTILMGKRFEQPREVIMENLRGIYERF